MGGGVVGLHMNCPLVVLLRSVEVAQVRQRHAAVVMGLCGIRADFQSRVVAADSLGLAAELVQSQATIGMRIGVGGLERQRSIKSAQRVCHLPALQVNHTRQMPSPRPLGITIQGLPGKPFGLDEVTPLVGSKCLGQRIWNLR